MPIKGTQPNHDAARGKIYNLGSERHAVTLCAIERTKKATSKKRDNGEREREREGEREREIKIRGSREEQNDQLTIRLSIGVGWFSNDATLSRTWSEILAFIIFNSS